MALMSINTNMHDFMIITLVLIRRFLVNPKRYDSLNLLSPNPNLVRTSEKFIVIALGLPTPKYEGITLV